MDYIKVYHKLEIINNKKQFVIYVDYPFEYEFSLDFNGFKIKAKQVSNIIKEYIKNNLSSVKEATLLLVLNGVIIGTVSLFEMVGPNVEKVQTTETDIAGKVESQSKDEVIKDTIISLESSEAEADIISDDNQLENKNNYESANADTISNSDNSNELEVSEVKNTNNSNIVTSNKKIQTADSSYSSIKTVNTPKVAITSNNTVLSSASNSTTISQGKTVKLKLNSGSIIDISLEDYVVGVVSSEMPALFNSEALKAQAVAARTYALKKNASGQILTATTADQVYRTNDELKSIWGSSYDIYYNKVRNAVLATIGEVATYNGGYIDALYFSTSNGRTEDPIYVWKYTAPYLKSVECKWDTGVSNFNATKTLSMAEISQKLDVSLTDISQIKINSMTTGSRVNSITVSGKEFTGVQIRTLLGLRSADFSVSQNGDNIVFSTKGYGHGVGMSQYGANEMAKAGYSYKEILRYFYTGVTIEKK